MGLWSGGVVGWWSGVGGSSSIAFMIGTDDRHECVMADVGWCVVVRSQIKGQIPLTIYQAAQLQFLDMSFNGFVGTDMLGHVRRGGGGMGQSQPLVRTYVCVILHGVIGAALRRTAVLFREHATPVRVTGG